jgi:hypothetical protein
LFNHGRNAFNLKAVGAGYRTVPWVFGGREAKLDIESSTNKGCISEVLFIQVFKIGGTVVGVVVGGLDAGREYQEYEKKDYTNRVHISLLFLSYPTGNKEMNIKRLSLAFKNVKL